MEKRISGQASVPRFPSTHKRTKSQRYRHKNRKTVSWKHGIRTILWNVKRSKRPRPRFGNSKTGENKKITLVIEKVRTNPVAFHSLIDREIGSILLTQFDPKSDLEPEKAFIHLKNRGTKKLILDLRDNPSESWNQAISGSNFFAQRK